MLSRYDWSSGSPNLDFLNSTGRSDQLEDDQGPKAILVTDMEVELLLLHLEGKE